MLTIHSRRFVVIGCWEGREGLILRYVMYTYVWLEIFKEQDHQILWGLIKLIAIQVILVSED